MIKGIEITDLTIGTGDEATKESIVAVNVREFLRRGDEVSPSPEFGTRMVIDLKRRECIAGLRYGIPGMRVGGTREIVISPHLAYGEDGIPGRIPANALLRCQIELIEIREHRGMRPQDWLPGKTLTLAKGKQQGWHFTLHEGGKSWLSFSKTTPDEQQMHARPNQIPIQLEAEHSAELIRQAMELQNQLPRECIHWYSGFREGGAVNKDHRDGAHYMFLGIMENGRTVLAVGVDEDSLNFRDSEFYKAIESLITPHLQ
jgi:hypothetical protein